MEFLGETNKQLQQLVDNLEKMNAEIIQKRLQMAILLSDIAAHLEPTDTVQKLYEAINEKFEAQWTKAHDVEAIIKIGTKGKDMPFGC